MSQHFDEHIKKRFGDYSPEVDPRTWENIVNRREKRRPGGWVSMLLHNRTRLLVLFLLLAGGSGAWLYTNLTYKNHKNEQALAGNTSGKPVNNSASTDNTNNTLLSEQTTTPVTTPVSTPAPAGDNTANALPAGTTTTTGTTGTSNTTTKNINRNINNDISAGTNNEPSSRPLKTGQKTTKSNAVQTGDNDVPVAVASVPSSLRTVRDARLKRGNRTRTSVQSPGINNNNPATATEESDEHEETLPAGGTLLGRLDFLAEKVMAKQKDKSRIPINTSLFSFLPGCPTLEKNAAGNKKYFELYAGADYGLRSFRDTGNSGYLQKRKESTSFTSGFSAGVRFTRVFNNSISIRGGVNFSQINERFRYSQGNVVQVTYIINPAGDTTGSFTTVGTRMKTTQNRFRTLDIPLVIGYELGNGRFHANINAGAVVNLYSWQRGEVLNDSLQPVNITTGKSNSPYQFKTNAGLGITGGVSMYYKLNDRWHIMAEPYFRYNLSPMNKENITLKQKYNTIGLRLGIRMDIP